MASNNTSFGSEATSAVSKISAASSSSSQQPTQQQLNAGTPGSIVTSIPSAATTIPRGLLPPGASPLPLCAAAAASRSSTGSPSPGSLVSPSSSPIAAPSTSASTASAAGSVDTRVNMCVPFALVFYSTDGVIVQYCIRVEHRNRVWQVTRRYSVVLRFDSDVRSALGDSLFSRVFGSKKVDLPSLSRSTIGTTNRSVKMIMKRRQLLDDYFRALSSATAQPQQGGANINSNNTIALSRCLLQLVGSPEDRSPFSLLPDGYSHIATNEVYVSAYFDVPTDCATPKPGFMGAGSATVVGSERNVKSPITSSVEPPRAGGMQRTLTGGHEPEVRHQQHQPLLSSSDSATNNPSGKHQQQVHQPLPPPAPVPGEKNSQIGWIPRFVIALPYAMMYFDQSDKMKAALRSERQEQRNVTMHRLRELFAFYKDMAKEDTLPSPDEAKQFFLEYRKRHPLQSIQSILSNQSIGRMADGRPNGERPSMNRNNGGLKFLHPPSSPDSPHGNDLNNPLALNATAAMMIGLSGGTVTDSQAEFIKKQQAVIQSRCSNSSHYVSNSTTPRSRTPNAEPQQPQQQAQLQSTDDGDDTPSMSCESFGMTTENNNTTTTTSAPPAAVITAKINNNSSSSPIPCLAQDPEYNFHADMQCTCTETTLCRMSAASGLQQYLTKSEHVIQVHAPTNEDPKAKANATAAAAASASSSAQHSRANSTDGSNTNGTSKKKSSKKGSSGSKRSSSRKSAAASNNSSGGGGGAQQHQQSYSDDESAPNSTAEDLIDE